MGTDKALLEIDGVPMVVRVAAALAAAGASHVAVVGGDTSRLRSLAHTVIADDHPGQGPLGGILTALAHGDPHELVAVLSCDLRAPSPDAIRSTVDALVDRPDGACAVPEAGGRPQWLHAAWRPSHALPTLTRAFDAGTRSVWRAVAGLAVVTVVGVPPDHLVDVDTRDDLGAHPLTPILPDGPSAPDSN
jgi:molybdenum cofactor guanylyltransferase